MLISYVKQKMKNRYHRGASSWKILENPGKPWKKTCHGKSWKNKNFGKSPGKGLKSHGKIFCLSQFRQLTQVSLQNGDDKFLLPLY